MEGTSNLHRATQALQQGQMAKGMGNQGRVVEQTSRATTIHHGTQHHWHGEVKGGMPGLTLNSASFVMLSDPFTGGPATQDSLESLVAALGWYDHNVKFETIPDPRNPLSLRGIGYRARFPLSGGSLSWYRDQRGKVVLSAPPHVINQWASQVAYFLQPVETNKKVKISAMPAETIGRQAALDRIQQMEYAQPAWHQWQGSDSSGYQSH